MRFVDFSTQNALAVDTAANNAGRGAEDMEYGMQDMGYMYWGAKRFRTTGQQCASA